MERSGRREAILAEGRLKLTQDFPRCSEEEHRSIMDELGEIRNKAGFDKAQLFLLEHLATTALPKNEVAADLQKELSRWSEIFFRLGETLYPFYDGMAEFVHGNISDGAAEKKVSDPKIIFEGRDSLPFLVAYTKRYGKKIPWMYSPVSRALFAANYHGETAAGQIATEQQHVVDFYKRNDLANKDLFFVDFGFGGTLPRLQQLILEYHGADHPKSVQIFLAVRANNKLVLNYFQPASFPSLDPVKIKNMNALDENMARLGNTEKMAGFINEGLQFFKVDAVNVAGNVGTTDHSYFKFLQEIGSYTKEAAIDALAEPGDRSPKSFGFASVQELTARFAFLKALIGESVQPFTTWEPSFKVLNTAYAVYKKHPDLFAQFKDVSDKPKTQAMFKTLRADINKNLHEEGLNIVNS